MMAELVEHQRSVNARGGAAARSVFAFRLRSTVIAGALLWHHGAAAQTLDGNALVSALRRGGYVLVMRHASSPTDPPTKADANHDNTALERQLDEQGRATAVAMGNALRRLQIPIGEVLTSPTYRARETARLARLPHPQPRPELGDGGRSMAGVASSQAIWLKEHVRNHPRGKNTILITHLPNISAAFPEWARGLSDGEALVLQQHGSDGATLVARVKIEDWPRLHD
jgi:phosphohistidine phosphatase SixA